MLGWKSLLPSPPVILSFYLAVETPSFSRMYAFHLGLTQGHETGLSGATWDLLGHHGITRRLHTQTGPAQPPKGERPLGGQRSLSLPLFLSVLGQSSQRKACQMFCHPSPLLLFGRFWPLATPDRYSLCGASYACTCVCSFTLSPFK